MTLGDLAGWSALAAVATLLASGVTIALFFGGAGAFWGPLNDLFTALTMILLLPVMLAVLRLAPDDIGPWFAILTFAAVAGILLGAAGQLLLVAGGISLQASFVTGGVGIAPVIAWAMGLTVLILTRDMLSVITGWLLFGVLVSVALLALASFVAPWPMTAAAAVLLLGLLSAWLAVVSGEVRTAV